MSNLIEYPGLPRRPDEHPDNYNRRVCCAALERMGRRSDAIAKLREAADLDVAAARNRLALNPSLACHIVAASELLASALRHLAAAEALESNP